MTSQAIMVALVSFVYEDEKGIPAAVHQGATVRTGHPMLKGREDMFTPLVVQYEHQVPVKRRPEVRHGTR